MSKYIIDVGEGYIRHGLERTLAIPVRINEHEDHWMDTRIPVTPYTAPDLEQVRKDYDAWYEKGLADAWDACRKIACYEIDGGYPVVYMLDLFDRDDLPKILSDYTAAEAIEKLKAYEQEQEELHVGDVVTFKTAYGEESGIVVECHVPDVYPDVDKYIVWCGGKVEYIVKEGLTKTGTHFPEVADLLKKMKEE